MRSSTVNMPFLRLVHQHRDDDLVEQRRGAADDVEVTVGGRVERTGTDGARHGRERYRSAVHDGRVQRRVAVPALPDRPAAARATGTARSRPARSTTTTASAASHPFAAAAASQPGHLRGRHVVGRVDEHDVVGPLGGHRPARRPRAPPAPAPRPARASADVAPQHAGRPPVGLDEQRVRRPARQRLQPERTGTGAQVEHRGAVEAGVGVERGEQRLPHPVRRRPGALAAARRSGVRPRRRR